MTEQQASVAGEPTFAGEIRAGIDSVEFLVEVPLSEPVNDQWADILGYVGADAGCFWESTKPGVVFVWLPADPTREELNAVVDAVSDTGRIYGEAMTTGVGRLESAIHQWWLELERYAPPNPTPDG